jgi:glycerol kinase
MIDHNSENLEDISKGEVLFGNMDTWLILEPDWGPHGGVHVTDVTKASRTLLMNIHSLHWDARMIEILDIP